MEADLMQDYFVARQPVYRSNLEVYGYELLYRERDSTSAPQTDDDLASTRVIINAFINIGLENLVGSNVAFFNVTRRLALSEPLLPMRPEQVAFEVPATPGPDPELAQALSALRERGFQVALTGETPSEVDPAVLQAADLVKIDVRNWTATALGELLANLRVQNPSLMLVAEKIETQDAFDWCREAGFDLFQGYFFYRPKTVRGRTVPTNKLVALRVIERLQSEDWTLDEVEGLLVQDVGLSYKLLRYVNSATLAIRREIDSVREALVLIGAETMRSWASMLLVANLNSEKPHELTKSAIVRGKMAELLGPRFGVHASGQSLFTIGLLSVLDALLDRPMDEILDTVSLSIPAKLALLDHEGGLGHVLEQVVNYEQGCFETLDTRTVTTAEYRAAYLEALRWAERAFASLPE